MRNTYNKLIIPLGIMLCLAGCGTSGNGNTGNTNKSEYTQAIEFGDTLDIKTDSTNLAMLPRYADGKHQEFQPLDQLKTYKDSGFRANFDRIFNINTVTNDGYKSKQGCLFVVKTENGDAHSGNSCMRDVFRNEVFHNYINSDNYEEELAEIINQAYSDVDPASKQLKNAAYNAYFNLSASKDDEPEYNGDKCLSRLDYYSMLYRATHGVSNLDEKYANTIEYRKISENDFNKPFILEMQPYNYLSMADGTIFNIDLSEPISQFEAVYMLENLLFKDKLDTLNLDSKASVGGYTYNPNINNDSGINLSTSNIETSRNLLGLMLVDKNLGAEENMIKAVGFGTINGLIVNPENNLNKPITKDEAITMFIKAFELENKLYGYATTSEYPELAIDNDIYYEELKNYWEQDDLTEGEQGEQGGQSETLENQDNKPLETSENQDNKPLETGNTGNTGDTGNTGENITP